MNFFCSLSNYPNLLCNFMSKKLALAFLIVDSYRYETHLVLFVRIQERFPLADLMA